MHWVCSEDVTFYDVATGLISRHACREVPEKSAGGDGSRMSRYPAVEVKALVSMVPSTFRRRTHWARSFRLSSLSKNHWGTTAPGN